MMPRDAAAGDGPRRRGCLASAVLAGLILTGLGGCGGDQEPAAGEAEATEQAGPPAEGAGQPGRQREATIERSGGLAGTLVVRPAVAQAGERLGVAVRNAGRVRMRYGLEKRVQRLTRGGWENAREEIYGSRQHGVRAIGLTVEPGERAGPRYSPVLADVIRLPADLRPGIYRVLKPVGARELTPHPLEVTLEAEFEVRSPP